MNLGPSNPNGTSTWKNCWADGPTSCRQADMWSARSLRILIPSLKSRCFKDPDACYTGSNPPLEGPMILGFEENGCWTNTTTAEHGLFLLSPNFVRERKASVTEQPERPEEARLWLLNDRPHWQQSQSNTLGLYMGCNVKYSPLVNPNRYSLHLSLFLEGTFGFFWKGYLRRWFSTVLHILKHDDSTPMRVRNKVRVACKPQRCPRPST